MPARHCACSALLSARSARLGARSAPPPAPPPLSPGPDRWKHSRAARRRLAHLSILRRWHVKMLTKKLTKQEPHAGPVHEDFPWGKLWITCKKMQTLCHDMSSLDRGLVLRLWSRLHLSIKVSNCGVLQQTDRALGRLLAGTKACQETRSTYSRPSISPNLEIRDLGPELYVFQMQRPVISLPRSRMKKQLLVRSRPPPLRGQLRAKPGVLLNLAKKEVHTKKRSPP